MSVDPIGFDYNASHLYFDRLLSRHIVVLFWVCIIVYVSMDSRHSSFSYSSQLIHYSIARLEICYIYLRRHCVNFIFCLTYNTKRVQCKFLNKLQHCISSDCGIINFMNVSNPVHCAVCSDVSNFCCYSLWSILKNLLESLPCDKILRTIYKQQFV